LSWWAAPRAVQQLGIDAPAPRPVGGRVERRDPIVDLPAVLVPQSVEGGG